MPPTSGIRGISRTSLWRAWKAIRSELKSSTQRDVVDHIEFDINPNVWIDRLIREIATGKYEPQPPTRFSLGKSKGFSRRMTLPAIPDLVLYRAIVDHLYQRARGRERRHVYFERAEIERARRSLVDTLERDLLRHSGRYEPLSRRRFRAWLCYDQYRKFLVFRRLYPTIVLTDITNFFDSILFDQVAASLHEIAAPRKMIGLLFFLLERMSIRGSFAESPRIGIPVDEFDCSRKLAHVLLFPHDDKMVDLVGEEGYVRWMDDQNLGVASRADGLRVLAAIGESLRNLHLTPNAGKSRLLSLSEARRHFHLDINRDMDRLEKLCRDDHVDRHRIAVESRAIWRKAKQHEGVGEWEKVLKRMYRFVGVGGARLLRRRAVRDTLASPGLATRISDYMRNTGTPTEYVQFTKTVWQHDEQVYGSANYALLEGLLRVDASGPLRRELRRVGTDLLRRKLTFAGWEDCVQLGPLLILRFGDRRSLDLLRRCMENDADKIPARAVRAAAIVYASYGRTYAAHVKRTAGRLLRGSLAVLVRMIDAIDDYTSVPGRMKHRMNVRYDAVGKRTFLDMRGIVLGRLLGLNKSRDVRQWLAATRINLLNNNLSEFDRRMLAQLWPE